MFNRKNRKVILFSVLVLIYSFILSIIVNYCEKLYLINNFNNKPYKKDSFFFHINKVDGENVILDGNNNDIFKKCICMRLDDKYDKHEIIFCDHQSVELMEGCIPDEHSYPWAYIGVKVAGKIGQKIEINEYEYEIIGVLKEHISEAINESVFYSKNIYPILKNDETYVLTSKNSKDIDIAYNLLKDYLAQKNVVLKRVDIRGAEFEDYMKNNDQLTYWIIITMLYLFFSLFAFWYGWLSIHKNEIKVLFLIGYEYTWIYLRLKYILVWCISLFINFVFIITLKEHLSNLKTIFIVQLIALILVWLSIVIDAILQRCIQSLKIIFIAEHQK